MQTPRNDPAKIRILIVDDHVVMRMGLVTAVNGEPDMEIVAEAENGVDAVEVCRQEKPDIVVLDLRMPGRNGIETIEVLRQEFPSVRVLVFSNYASGDEVIQSFKRGAAGFVAKDMPLERLLEAIRCVHQGGQYVPAEIAVQMGRTIASNLSQRELEVLALVAKGMSNKEIAATLHLVEGTVKIHLTNILAKLDVADRTQAVLAAVKRGIVQID